MSEERTIIKFMMLIKINEIYFNTSVLFKIKSNGLSKENNKNRRERNKKNSMRKKS